jgi:mannose/cellobiose epimerase-like protein (N-acyl-D-glucosamine 2-epimerase family)
MIEIVRRHVLWMFEMAERVEGLWGRSYLATGRIKDRAYQLDQQLFPLLELADYVLATGDQALLHQLEEKSVLPLIGILLARRAPQGWLFSTDETPADDPLTLPYHLSSHILMWRTFRRLAEAGMSAGLASMAEDIRGDINTHFVAEHVRLCDGRSRHLPLLPRRE